MSKLRLNFACGPYDRTQALRDGNRTEALHAVQEARPWLARQEALAAEFDKLEKQAR